MSIVSRILGWLPGGGPSGRPERLPSPDELVLLAEPNGEGEAQIFHDMLEQQGIRSMIKNTDAASARAGGLGPPWAYELWVLRKDLHRGREILGLDE